MNPKILIADDHPILLKGLKEFLISKKFNVIGAETNGQKALNAILQEKPDIAILDIDMPDLTGIEIAKLCNQKKVDVKIILITMHKEITYYLNAKKHNINGYLLKEFTIDEIEKCISEVLNGNNYFSSKITKSLEFTESDDKILSILTYSELRILKLVSQYKSNKEIAELLFISYRTVEKHRNNIRLKLKINKRKETLLIWLQKNKHLLNNV